METYTKISDTEGKKVITPEAPEVAPFEVIETVEQIEADIAGLLTAISNGNEQIAINEVTLAQRKTDLANLKASGVISLAEQAELQSSIIE